MIIAVTGHRPPKLGGYRTPNPIYRAVRSAIIGYLQQKQAEIVETPDTLIVLSGMALGVDQWTAEICNEWGIPWDAIIPFRGFESRWPDDAQRRYHQLLTTARTMRYVTDTYEYKASHLYRRNAWMVDNSDHVLAVWNGSAGGTANCVEYARRRGKRVEVLPLPIEIWDQAREFEQRTAGRRSRLDVNNQYLANSLHFRPQDEPVSREYAERNLRIAQQRALLDMNLPLMPAREYEELTDQQRALHINLNNDIFYNNQEEEPATVPHMTSSGNMVERLQETVRALETGQPRPGAPSAAQAETQRDIAEEHLGVVRRHIEQSMLRFVGQPITPVTTEQINRQLQATLEEIRNVGIIHGDIRVRVANPVEFVGLDFAVPGMDRAVAQVVQVVQEEPKKEVITPEKRFLPGRIIDIED